MRIRALALFVFFAAQARGESALPNLLLSIDPATVSNSGSTELICRVTIPDAATSCTVDVQPPLGFRAEPRSITITGAALPLVVMRKVTLTPVDTYQNGGTKVVRADLFASDTNGPIRLAAPTQQTSFEYVNCRLSIRKYLWIGFFGIVIGYLIRFLINILKTIPAPSPFARDADSGPITAFVQKYYYWIDGFVTVVLGLVILVSFVKNDFPPEAAARWYGALVVGVGVGALTNSELLTRLIAGLPRSGSVVVSRTV